MGRAYSLPKRIKLSSQSLKLLESTRQAIALYRNKTSKDFGMLNWAVKKLETEPFSNDFICTLHSRLDKSIKDAGAYRKLQNWIGPNKHSSEGAYFFPPPPKAVNKLMDEWIEYANSTTKDPLIQLATLFAQFLIIHPFMDGNGRVARLFVPLFLYKHRITSSPCLFLNDYLKKYRLAYFRKLYAISSDGDWESWIVFFLKGLKRSAKNKKTPEN